jgi:hypothetical protein
MLAAVVAALQCTVQLAAYFTLRKLECSRQSSVMNTLAWNNGMKPEFYFIGY